MALSLLTLAAAGGCREGAANTLGTNDEAHGTDLPVVRVVRPIAREITDYAYYTGRTEAIESVDVQSRVTGYLQSIDFQAGQVVRAGQRLFLIDPRPYQAALDEAKGQLALAEARLRQTIADLKRAEGVAQTPGAISQRELDRYIAAKDEAQAAVAAAEAKCESARLNVEFTEIFSPIDGRVGRNLLTLGNLVRQDDTILATLVSEDPIYAYFDVDEPTMLRLARWLGQSADVRTPPSRSGAAEPAPRGNDAAEPASGGNHPGRIPDVVVEMGLADENEDFPHRGKLDFIDNRLVSSTGTLQLRAVFANPPQGPVGVRLLKPGMFVRIRLAVGQPYSALLVPQSAVGTDQGRHYVLVVDAQGTLGYRAIELGPRQPGGLQVVLSARAAPAAQGTPGTPGATAKPSPGAAAPRGLGPDEWVVVAGLQRLRPGMRVKVESLSDPPRAEASPAAGGPPSAAPTSRTSKNES